MVNITFLSTSMPFSRSLVITAKIQYKKLNESNSNIYCYSKIDFSREWLKQQIQ